MFNGSDMKKKKEDLKDNESDPDIDSTDQITPENQVELRNYLAIINDLEPPKPDIFKMHVKGYTQAEIGEELNIEGRPE